MHDLKSQAHRGGFSLIELLVVLFIIILLLSLLIPTLSSIRESSRHIACKNNLKQIGLAILSYESTYSRFPPSSWTTNNPYNRSGKYIGWKTLLLPFLEESSLNIYDRNKHWWESPNIQIGNNHLSVFLCPSAIKATALKIIPEKKPRPSIVLSFELARCDYEAIMGVQPPSINAYLGNEFYNNNNRNNIMYRNSTTRVGQVTDGLSKTILLSECASRPDIYINGIYLNGQINNQGIGWIDSEGSFSFDGSSQDGLKQGCGKDCYVSINSTNYNEPYSFHHNCISVLFANGGVTTIYSSINIEIFSSLLTINGNEAIILENRN